MAGKAIILATQKRRKKRRKHVRVNARFYLLLAFIILLIAAALHSLMKYAGVNAFLAGVRPCVVAMILATACTMGLSTLGGFTTVSGGFAPDVRALAVFALLGILHFAYKKKTQKAPSPIGMILLSAVLGAVLWSI